MQRRSVLAAGASAAVTLLSPGGPALAVRKPAVRTTVPSARTWVCPPNRYEIALHGTTVSCDCYALDAPAATSPVDADPRNSAALSRVGDAAIAVAGPDRQPVVWEAEAWHEPDAFALTLNLRGKNQPLRAALIFAVDQASGLLSAQTVLHNDTRAVDIDLAATLGFWFGVHEPVDTVIYLTGAWAQETRVRHAGPDELPLTLESRAGKTGFEFQPYVSLLSATSTVVCEVFWSGNWTLQVVPDADGAVLLGGFNNWQFHHRLPAGESLTLPVVLFGRVEGRLDDVTRHLHDYRRAHRPNPNRPIPVQFNSWYPYAGEPSTETMLPLIPAAKQLGCEVFVVDAGWYRTDDGESDGDWAARTGDWRVSHRRFPNGLHEVSQHCREHGLQFGLWFEPEVIGPTSTIRREHPQWLHNIAGVPPSENKRAILNLGVPAAWQHVFDRVTRMIRALDLGWMKWDFNADLGAGGWAPGLPAELTGQDPLVAHYRGLYRLQDAIREAFPDLVLEMCASGGGRMDGEILSHAHVNWISDQAGPLRKLAIHFGTGLAHPAVVCNDWLVAWPPGRAAGYDERSMIVDMRGDLPFRLRVAMLGSFGFSARVDRWSDADFRTAADHAALYATQLRSIIHHGDQYHLTRAPPPDGNGDWAAMWYVAKNGLEGVLFAFRLASADGGRTFGLAGLQPERRYRATMSSGTAIEADGRDLARGLAVAVGEQFQSELCVVEAV